MYEGRTDLEKAKIVGHENLGEVIEIGNAVDRIKVGDKICLPFNIACGFCDSDLIHVGKAKPSFIVSHALPLSSAPDAYQHFDDRDKGWTKVILKPLMK